MAFKLERPLPETSEVVTAFRDGFVGPRSWRRDEGFTFSDLEQGYQGVHAGDLVFHGLDGFAGAFGVAVATGRCTPVYHVMTCPEDDARFVAYALRVAAYSGLLEVQVPSTRQRAVDFRNWSTLAPVPLPRPPIACQRRIADFLDDQTTRVGQIIDARLAQIALLKALGRSRLSAVTFPGVVLPEPTPAASSAHFVDPFVKDPPLGWTRLRLRSVLAKSSIASGGRGRLLSVYLDRGVIPFDDAGPDRVHNPSLDLSAYQRVCAGDLVMNNQQAWRGSVGVSRHIGIISPAYHVYRINKSLLDPEWADFAFRSNEMVFLYEQASRGVGSIQRNLDSQGLMGLPICIPDKVWQKKAARAAAELMRATTDAVTALDGLVRLQQDLKRSLISAAVSGEFDVVTASSPGVSA